MSAPEGASIASSDGPRNRALDLLRQKDSKAIRRYKKGFFQRFELTGEWTDPSGDTGLGIVGSTASLTVAVPLGSFENLLLITPSFAVDSIDAADELGVPNELYNTSVDFMWRKAFDDRWGAMVAVTPGYASDFVSSDGAFRIQGRAFATWQWFPERLTVLFGVVYLDRNDIPLLPGVGLIWTPTPDWRLDLLFPRPKIAYRTDFLAGSHEQWLYAKGQLGGRTWAVRREDHLPDELTLRDYRLSVGWEWIVEGGGGVFAEAGWSFGRELEYERQAFSASFDDTFFISAGLRL